METGPEPRFSRVFPILENILRRKLDCLETDPKNRESIFSAIEAADLVIVKEILGMKCDITTTLEHPEIFLHSIADSDGIIAATRVDRCLGSYIGMVLGDFLGAPIEFLEAREDSESITFDDTTQDGFQYSDITRNVFQLETGQWTDDAAMGACIADSLIVMNGFCGGDIRSRFWNWWANGYNNAFLLSKHRSPYRSVGLGGNISKSIAAVNGMKHADIPPKYHANTQDSGNGGLMRLAAIPIFYSDSQVEETMSWSRASSETTHPGCLASRCAEFVAFVIHTAINRAANTGSIKCQQTQEDISISSISASDFIESVVSTYLKHYCDDSREGNATLRRLLLSNEPPESTELAWNWRERRLQIEKCCAIRGDNYNGYANDLSYYGSYCMDGLAIALNAVKHGTSVASTLKLCIDYRGDADSTGSIAGQIAGAFYGISGISGKLMNHAFKWDHGEHLVRAAMLTPWYQKRRVAGTAHCILQQSPLQLENAIWATHDFVDSTHLPASATQEMSSTKSGGSSWFSRLVSSIGQTLGIKNASDDNSHRLDDEWLREAALGRVAEFNRVYRRLQGNAAVASTANARRGRLFFCVDGNGWTCLQLASGKGHSDMVSAILSLARADCESQAEFEAFLSHKGENEFSALLLALANGHEQIACQLIREGAPLDGAIGRNRNVAFLIGRSGAELAAQEITNQYGESALLSLANECDANGFNALMAAALMNQAGMCSLLLRVGVSVRAVSKDGSSAFHFACRPHSLCVVSSSSRSADISLQVSEPKEAKELGSAAHSADALKILLGASEATDMALADSFGSTPLHTAVRNGNIEAVRCILQKFPIESLVAQDNDGLHVLHACCSEVLRNVALQAQESNEDSRRQIEHHMESCKTCLEDLVEAGYPLDTYDYSDDSIFHVLCYNVGDTQLRLIRSLCEFMDASTNYSTERAHAIFETANDAGWTCLHVAASTGGRRGAEAVELLLRGYVSQAFADAFDPKKPKETGSNSYLLRRGAHNRIPIEARRAMLSGDYTPDGLAKYLQSLPHTPRVVVLAGAGISTSVGIKDFRSADGLYADKSTAELFSTEFLQRNPEQFYAQMRQLFMPVIDRQIRPSKTHAFLRWLKQRGWLLRLYTQNIDMLDYNLLEDEDVVECHGSCRTAYCMNRQCPVRLQSAADMERHYWGPMRDGANPTCMLCGGFLRPDVTFFGEPMPPKFEMQAWKDLPNCDLVLVLGTSLKVYPVAGLPQMAGPHAVRVLVNREPSGCFQFAVPFPVGNASVDAAKQQQQQQQRQPWLTSSYRDVLLLGSCDDGVELLVNTFGPEAKRSFDDIVREVC